MCLETRASGKSVRLVYLVPTGGNPTGTLMSLQRRKDIYSVAKELDLIILEDGMASSLLPINSAV